MKYIFLGAVVSVFVLFFAAEGLAQSKTRVRFAKGTHGTSVTGTVRGYGYRDYVVGASALQAIEVSLKASTPSTVFTIFKPDGNNLDEAAETEEYKGTLADSGDYVIRVLMMRVAARRRGSISNFTLKISIRKITEDI